MVASVCIQSGDSKDGAEGFIVESTWRAGALLRWGRTFSDLWRFMGEFFMACVKLGDGKRKGWG